MKFIGQKKAVFLLLAAVLKPFLVSKKPKHESHETSLRHKRC
jgi:hypothetical protein